MFSSSFIATQSVAILQWRENFTDQNMSVEGYQQYQRFFHDERGNLRRKHCDMNCSIQQYCNLEFSTRKNNMFVIIGSCGQQGLAGLRVYKGQYNPFIFITCKSLQLVYPHLPAHPTASCQSQHFYALSYKL